MDGRRDLTALSSTLGRNLLDVATIVHALIGAGLLALREAGAAPRRHQTPPSTVVVDVAIALPVATVASTAAKPSIHAQDAAWPGRGMDAEMLCTQGDSAALRGDLAAALTFWSAALRGETTLIDADRVREAIALAARLHALLYPTRRG